MLTEAERRGIGNQRQQQDRAYYRSVGRPYIIETSTPTPAHSSRNKKAVL